MLAGDSSALGLEIIVHVDLRVSALPVGAGYEVLAESQRLSTHIVVLVLQFLYDLSSYFVSELLNVSKISVYILEFLLYQCIFHDLPLHPLDDLVRRLWLPEAASHVLWVAHFVALVGTWAVSKALGSS